MTTIEYIIGAILLIIAVGLVVTITMQKSRQRGLSASLAGSSAESYYGKNKGMTKQKVLNTVTTVLAIVFCVLVLLLYILHTGSGDSTSTTSTASAAEESQTTAVSNEESAAETVSETVSEPASASEDSAVSE